jgi:hypothetical protein
MEPNLFEFVILVDDLNDDPPVLQSVYSPDQQPHDSLPGSCVYQCENNEIRMVSLSQQMVASFATTGGWNVKQIGSSERERRPILLVFVPEKNKRTYKSSIRCGCFFKRSVFFGTTKRHVQQIRIACGLGIWSPLEALENRIIIIDYLYSMDDTILIQ